MGDFTKHNLNATEWAMLEMVSIPTLCRILEVKERTLRSWVTKREIPYHKLGKLVRFKMKEIESWAGARRILPLTPDVLRGKIL
jgi:excisionase family DNA binding protein